MNIDSAQLIIFVTLSTQYSTAQSIILIMASQESQSLQTTCATLPESEILTESELDELANILTDSRQTTRDQRLAIKTALQFKVP